MFGITAFDPLTYAIRILCFVALGLAASIVPARRAARIDPVIALRAE
jgi:ABC-type antimicrobial peptide transport system permease subunit